MSGNKIGAAKAKQNYIKRLGGEEAYHAHMQAIGSRGGANGVGHEYGHGKVDPRINGSLGGKNSIRGFKYLGTYPDGRHYERRTDGEIIVK